MTYKSFKKKYEGRYIRVTMHYFPHSIELKQVEGKVIAVKNCHAVVRDGQIKLYDHYDFILESKEVSFIDWNDMKLIERIEEDVEPMESYILKEEKVCLN